MALSYATATALSASGFLAAFAAGLDLRQVELYVVKRDPPSDVGGDSRVAAHPPAEVLVNPNSRDPEDARTPAASMGMVVSDALSFGDMLEPLIAAALVLLPGAAFANYRRPAGMLVALVLFVFVRPLAACLSTIGSRIPVPRRLRLVGSASAASTA